jgi:phosphoribosyl 1,2-cyclic phosphodiesterase
MKINNLASSSSGNCTHISTDTASILIDTGGPALSMKKIFAALGHQNIDAVFITHEHGDHMGVAGPLGRKLKIPLYMHRDSYERYEHNEWFEKFAYDKKADVNGRKPKFVDCNVKYLDPSAEYTVGDLIIKPFSTPHDSVYSVGYVVTDTTTNKKLGYLTDCGSFTKVMYDALKDCDAYMIEADYDEQGLEDYDGYDDLHKDRLRSSLGHLSNAQTLEFLESLGIDTAEFVMFCHLSPRTNSPEVLLKMAGEVFPEYGKFLIAPNDEVLEL